MRKLAGLCAALLLLSGCQTDREPEDLSLVRVLGVDGSGPVELMAVCGGLNQADVSRGVASGDDFAKARRELPWAGEEKLSLTSVSYLIVGTDTDLQELLLAVVEDAELGALATVWLAPDGAAAVLERCSDPASDLDLLSRQGIGAPTAAGALAAIATDGMVELPCVCELGERLTERGMAEWKTID